MQSIILSLSLLAVSIGVSALPFEPSELPTCPFATTWNGLKCVTNLDCGWLDCAEGFRQQGCKCVLPAVEPCAPPSKLILGHCVPEQICGWLDCRQGYHQEDCKCVKDSAPGACQPPLIWDGIKCRVLEDGPCPPGSIRVAHLCVEPNRPNNSSVTALASTAKLSPRSAPAVPSFETASIHERGVPSAISIMEISSTVIPATSTIVPAAQPDWPPAKLMEELIEPFTSLDFVAAKLRTLVAPVDISKRSVGSAELELVYDQVQVWIKAFLSLPKAPLSKNTLISSLSPADRYRIVQSINPWIQAYEGLPVFPASAVQQLLLAKDLSKRSRLGEIAVAVTLAAEGYGLAKDIYTDVKALYKEISGSQPGDCGADWHPPMLCGRR